MHNSKTGSKNKIQNIVKQFGRVLFSLIGLICSSIFLFMLLNSGYSKIFDPSMISNCSNSNSTNGSTYLLSVYSVEALLIVLDVISIIFFAFLLFLSISYALCSQDSQSFQLKQGIRVVSTYFLLLFLGCIFGNCVKTIVSLNQVLACTSAYSNVEHFSKNTQSLALIGGISILAAIGLLLSNSILIRRKQEQEIKAERKQIPQYHSRSQEMILLPTKNQAPLEISISEKLPSEFKSEYKNQEINKPELQKKNHKPRLFGKQFIGSRYVQQFSSQSKSIEQSKNKIETIKNQRINNENTPYQKLFNKPINENEINVRAWSGNQNLQEKQITFGSEINKAREYRENRDIKPIVNQSKQFKKLY